MSSSNNRPIDERERSNGRCEQKDQEPVRALEEAFPTYADKFPLFSAHASGMNQYVAWTALEAEGFGANLQVRDLCPTAYSLL